MTALKDIRGFLLDLDGTVYIGNAPLPGARDFVAHCLERRVPFAFVSNQSSQSRAQVTARLARVLSLEVPESCVLVATRALAQHLAAVRPGARVHVLGGEGLAEELTSAGLTLVDQDAEVVVSGVWRAITYEKLALVGQELLAGAALFSINDDPNYPDKDGIMPGGGSFRALLEKCSGVKATVVGKPERLMFDQAREYLGLPADQIAMVGDMHEIDIIGARRAGMPGILIGRDKSAHELVVEDLGELLKLIA